MVDLDIRRASRALRNLLMGAFLLHAPAFGAFSGRLPSSTETVVNLVGVLVLMAGAFRLSALLTDPGDRPFRLAMRASVVAYGLILPILLVPIEDGSVLRPILSTLALAVLASGFFLGRRTVLLLEEWKMPAAAHRMRRTTTLYGWLLLLPLGYYHAATIASGWVAQTLLPRAGFHLWAGYLAGFIPIVWLARTASTLEQEAEIADWLEK